jgi:hypothetical protein
VTPDQKQQASVVFECVTMCVKGAVLLPICAAPAQCAYQMKVSTGDERRSAALAALLSRAVAGR